MTAANGDLTLAASLFFDQSAEPGPAEAEAEDSEPDIDMAGDDQEPPPPSNPTQPVPGGGRTLDGTYVAPAAGSASSSQQPSSSRQPAQRGMRTIQDLQSSGGGHGHAHDDGDRESDDDYNDENQDFFAGGEKSGLAVQNPNQPSPADHINNILKRARQYVGCSLVPRNKLIKP